MPESRLDGRKNDRSSHIPVRVFSCPHTLIVSYQGNVSPKHAFWENYDVRKLPTFQIPRPLQMSRKTGDIQNNLGKMGMNATDCCNPCNMQGPTNSAAQKRAEGCRVGRRGHGARRDSSSKMHRCCEYSIRPRRKNANHPACLASP